MQGASNTADWRLEAGEGIRADGRVTDRDSHALMTRPNDSGTDISAVDMLRSLGALR